MLVVADARGAATGSRSASMNETTMTVTGNISTDVTSKRVGAEGALVVSFRIISSPRRWDRATDSWTDAERFSARVSCWRRLGENVMTSLRKGDPVFIHGRAAVHEYEVNGERRQSIEINASTVGPDLGRCPAAVVRRKSAGPDEAEGRRDDVEAGSGPLSTVFPESASGTDPFGDDLLESPEDEQIPSLAPSA
jgi:single-strand DNA-binding protein